MGGAPCFDWV